MNCVLRDPQGAAIWAFVLSRPLAFWPYMRLTLGPRLRILATGLPRWMRRRQTPAPGERRFTSLYHVHRHVQCSSLLQLLRRSTQLL